jgi:hypothetical protein
MTTMTWGVTAVAGPTRPVGPVVVGPVVEDPVVVDGGGIGLVVLVVALLADEHAPAPRARSTMAAARARAAAIRGCGPTW